MSLAAADFTYIADLVHREAAIVLEPGKEYLAETRLLPIVRENGLDDLAALVGQLRAAGTHDLRDRVVEAMTTNETSWFRDLHPFEALRETVLPELIERRRARRSLTIWCAASSSGQEPYSLAMTVREHFPELDSWVVRILCTDISSAMVERTRTGRYSQLEVNRGLPAKSLVRWFDRDGTAWIAKPELRRMIDVRRLNLAGPWPALPAADVVLMRNVLIYFDTKTKTQVLEGVHKVMQPDGYLFLGGAESTLNLHDGFERVPLGRAICHRARQ